MNMANLISEEKKEHVIDDEDHHKYVVFKIGDEIYASPLLSVREVVEVQAIKKIPNTIPAFVGVCNLRGQIVGILDLNLRFGLDRSPDVRPVLLVFELDSGALAALVDQIVAVEVLETHQIDYQANIVSAVPIQFVRGIAMKRGMMITIIDLRALLSADEVVQLNQTKMLARSA